MKTRTITLHHDEHLIITLPQGTITVNVTGKQHDSAYVSAATKTHAVTAVGKNLSIEPAK